MKASIQYNVFPGGGGLGVGLGIYLRPREGGNNVSVHCEATVIQFVGPGPVPTSTLGTFLV